MPSSYRDIVAYGDFVLPHITEGVLLRVGRGNKVEGMLLTIGAIPELNDHLNRKIEKINGRAGLEILLAPEDVGAIAIANNLSDLANIAQARINLGLRSAALREAGEFELAGAALSAIASLKTEVGLITNSQIAIGRNTATERLEVFGGNIKILRDTTNKGGYLIFQNLAASTTISHYLWYSPTLGVLRRLSGATAPANLDADGGFANCNPPANTQVLTASSTISVQSDILPVSANTAITLISTPAIQVSGMSDGALIKILNIGSNNITFQGRNILMNSGVSLGASSTKALVPNQFLQFMFFKGIWYLGGA